MVKKTSLFSKLKNRWKSASGVRVESGRGVERRGTSDRLGADRLGADRLGAAAPSAEAQPDEPAEPRRLPARPPAEPRSSRKLSDREEALVAMGEGFRELSSLMRGMQTRIEGQGSQLAHAVENLKLLPALGNTQLEMMRRMAAHMERQTQLSETMAKSLSGVPDTLGRVEEALDRAAATDDRTAKSLNEFKGTMERIHDSMDQMVAHSSTQADTTRKLAEGRDSEHRQQVDAMRSVVDHLESSQRDALTSLRRTHEDQSNRLQRVVREHAGWNRAVLVGLGVVVLGLAAAIAILIFK